MYTSQTDTVINYIRANQGCSRSTLIDLKSNGERIANLTARISQARKKLIPLGETILCMELPSRNLKVKNRKVRLRRTSYHIVKLP